MIKIGKTYIDDEFRWALSPSFGYEDNQYMAVLQNGTKVNFHATSEMIDAAMQAAGWNPEEAPDLRSCFTEEEWEEVEKAIDEGYNWLAKDKRGITCAYIGKPVQEGAYWNDAQGNQPKRLFCDFNCLEEGECTSLTDLFGACSIEAGEECDGTCTI